MGNDANARQVGGQHYKTGYEHWDLVLAVNQGYHAGRATAYVARWRHKGNGKQDLEKAAHFVQKVWENASLILIQSKRPPLHYMLEEVSRFATVNKLTDDEKAIVQLLTIWRTRAELEAVHDMINSLINAIPTEVTVQYTSPEAQPVPLTEENKHGER